MALSIAAMSATFGIVPPSVPPGARSGSDSPEIANEKQLKLKWRRPVAGHASANVVFRGRARMNSILSPLSAEHESGASPEVALALSQTALPPAAPSSAPISRAPATRRPARSSTVSLSNGDEIRVYQGIAELSELARDWQSLDAVAESPAEQFIWLQSAATALLDDDSLRVATVWRGPLLQAAAPLALRRHGAFERARLLGVGDLWEPMDLVAVDAPRASRWCDFLSVNSVIRSISSACPRIRRHCRSWPRRPGVKPLGSRLPRRIAHISSSTPRGASRRAI